ncbi:MAG: homoserine dehydrogenase [Hyphomicrobiaceae bacterium]
MIKPLRLGVAGLGTVGSGLLRLMQAHGTRFAEALGRTIVVAGVSARARRKDRGISLDDMAWFDDPVELAADPSIDVLVELIGGDDGPAKATVEAALAAGKPVVTANKALLARHGVELARLAEKHGVALNFEAAVAGGIPVIKALREALAGNEIRRVYGILNGTCNYILTKMQDEHRAFADVLKEAQAKGYAEADPTFDIGGFDTAHKLALLTSLAFGTRVAFDQIDVEGIEAVTQADIEAAEDLGYRIKLLGVALLTESGIEQRVHPAMVPQHSAIAEVSGVTNCVAIDGDSVGNLLLVGPGAGAGPTASAVMADILDIARGAPPFPFRVPAARLRPYRRARLGRHQGAYYVRLAVYDRPGALAAIAGRMGEQQVSLESIVQRRPRGAQIGINARLAPGAPTPVILITHETTEQAIRAALDAIHRDGNVSEKPQMIRIEPL